MVSTKNKFADRVFFVCDNICYMIRGQVFLSSVMSRSFTNVSDDVFELNNFIEDALYEVIEDALYKDVKYDSENG